MDVVIEKINRLIEEKSQYYQDEHFEILLRYLRRDDKENDLDIFCEWVKGAVSEWCTVGLTPPHNVLCFVLKLGCLLSENEKRFSDLNSGSFFLKLVTLSKIKSSKLDVTLAYIELLMTLLDHKSGVEKMIACNFWDDILYLGLSNQNQMEFVQLASKFLTKVLEHDVEYFNEIIKLLPLGQNTFQFIENILINMLERKNLNVVLHFCQNFRSQENLPSKKITFLLKFADLRSKIISNGVRGSERYSLLNDIKSDFLMNISNDNFYELIDFCRFGILLWKLLDFVNQNEDFSFIRELVVMLMLPNYSLILKYALSSRQLEQACCNDEFRDLFVDKIIKSHRNDITRRLFFKWRDRLALHSDLFTICASSFFTVKNLYCHFSKNEAVLIFQCAIYKLKDIIISMTASPQKLVLFQNHQEYIWNLFDLIGMIIREFQITWKDSFEAVDVMDVAFDFFKFKGWSVDLTVKILEIIKIASENYMFSGLVLMVDDTTLASLGSFTYHKLHEEVSEIQKGALEVVCSMVHVTRSSKLNFAIKYCAIV